MAKLYGFDEEGRKRYAKIEKKVLGAGRQTHTFKKWERPAGGGREFIILGEATAAVDDLDSTFTIDNLQNVTPGALPSEPLTVNNTLNLTLADNQKVYAILDVDSQWETWGGQGEQGPAGESTLFAKFHATATSSHTTDTITGDIDDYWGGTPGSTTGVTVNKLSDHDTTVYSGDKFIGVWVPDDEAWNLLWFDGMRVTVRGTISGTAVTPATSTFSLSSGALVNGWRLPGSITVTNTPAIYADVGATVYARFNLTIGSDPTASWDTGDGGNWLHILRGLGSWNDGTNITQVVGQKAGAEEWYGMASIAISQAAEDFLFSDTSFDTDSHTVLCGDTPSSTQTVSNTNFDLSGADNDPVLIIKDWDSADWHAIRSRSANIRFARVTTEVSAATDQLTANWGSGQVKLQHPTTGVLAASAISVNNLNIGTAFVVDSQVQVDVSYSPPRVLNGTCDAVSWS